ncbi:MAG: extracellular solute-binding protein family 5 [Thermomicrobiales bacterium]|jgi:peptide/nickel transport system substrate-binding protein|nr:extracellular solute-binding protein family 5 [Thermomicrobiales bacterium]MDF3038829.1 extracellular solute-binding protein family 5 [Thermomicrobiales bacterium]
MIVPRIVRAVVVLTLLAVIGAGLFVNSVTPPAAARSQAEGEPVQGGVLRLALGEEPDQLDPARTISLTASEVMQVVYDRLVYIDDEGLPQPWIAESWEISDDGKTISFTIREGMKFHDGTDVDANAVKFTYDRILDPEMAAPYKSFVETLESVDVPDARTAVFTFSEPYAPFFTNSTIIGIVSPAAVEQFGDDFGHNPVGSGPFMFREWQPGTKIVFDRNPDYVNPRMDDTNKGPAYVDSLEYNIIGEAATRTAAFENQELDLLDVPFEDVARLQETPGVAIVSLTEPNNFNYVEFSDREPFNNVAFRQAINYAIDRDAIVEFSYLGQATANQCPLPVGNAAYDADLCAEHGYTYDLEQARAKLAEAGLTDGDGNGYVEMDGEELGVTLWSYTGFPERERAQEIMQAAFDEIGLRTEIQSVDFGALQPMMESGETGMDYMRWTLVDQSILSSLFLSPGWTGQTNEPELDELLTVANTTVDPEARLEASYAAMVYILQNALVAPIASDWINVAVHDNVQNYHWDALNIPRLNDVWLAQ